MSKRKVHLLRWPEYPYTPVARCGLWVGHRRLDGHKHTKLISNTTCKKCLNSATAHARRQLAAANKILFDVRKRYNMIGWPESAAVEKARAEGRRR